MTKEQLEQMGGGDRIATFGTDNIDRIVADLAAAYDEETLERTLELACRLAKEGRIGRSVADVIAAMNGYVRYAVEVADARQVGETPATKEALAVIDRWHEKGGD